MSLLVAAMRMQRPMLASRARHLHSGLRARQDAKLFDTVLIANRGEIACRVMKTCKRLGIRSVAVYSDADAEALHVRMADEKYRLGPAPSAQSYLVIDKVLEAVEKTGAQAVHPGYGFLSENRLFAQALEERGVAFVGPKSHAIEVMGDKLQSKVAAAEAQVNIIPGYNGVIKDADEAVKISQEIGYPVMLKASAGGGGKGMRVAWNDKQCRSGFRLASEEARSSFGDDRILIEKFIDNPRHIEIQVLADAHGNAVYLNERECSIQRRNQKVVEEAPSKFLDPETRAAMGAQAVALARAVQYQSAGTVEFLVDPQRNFYFLEMNTRLQVEHPITECITGVDIVEHMLRVAAGEKLSLQQSDIGINGWAFESRVYAEDPFKMLPSTGRLSSYQPPVPTSLTPGVRVDTGVTEGSDISMYYDPMIAKLVTHGKTREDAMEQMRKALDSYFIKGVNHNIPLLRDILSHPRMASGDISTKFIEEVYPEGFKGYQLRPVERQQLVTAAAFIHATRQINNQAFTNQRVAPWEYFYSGEVLVSVGGDEEAQGVRVGIEVEGRDQHTIRVGDGEPVVVRGNWSASRPVFEVDIGGETAVVQYLDRRGTRWSLGFCGSVYTVTVQDPLEHSLAQFLPEMEVDQHADSVLSPMTGAVISVSVRPGDMVNEAQEVAVVEAMKMQNLIMAPRAGLVKQVVAVPGASIQEDGIMVELYPATETGLFAPAAGTVSNVKKPDAAVLIGDVVATVTTADGDQYPIRANVAGHINPDFALKEGQAVGEGESVGKIVVEESK